jgi:glutamine synthetase
MINGLLIVEACKESFAMADTKPDPKAVLDFVKENNVQMLDLRFTDLPGLWHHVSYPIAMLSESSF